MSALDLTRSGLVRALDTSKRVSAGDDLTRDFAMQTGYTGDSPAMLAAMEQIRQSGIRRARDMHFERVKLLEQFKASPKLFWGYINLFRPTPILSTQEAVEFYRKRHAEERALVAMRHWRADPGKVRMCGERLVLSRYFRRYGGRVWTRRAA